MTYTHGNYVEVSKHQHKGVTYVLYQNDVWGDYMALVPNPITGREPLETRTHKHEGRVHTFAKNTINQIY